MRSLQRQAETEAEGESFNRPQQTCNFIRMSVETARDRVKSSVEHWKKGRRRGGAAARRGQAEAGRQRQSENTVRGMKLQWKWNCKHCVQCSERSDGNGGQRMGDDCGTGTGTETVLPLHCWGRGEPRDRHNELVCIWTVYVCVCVCVIFSYLCLVLTTACYVAILDIHLQDTFAKHRQTSAQNPAQHTLFSLSSSLFSLLSTLFSLSTKLLQPKMVDAIKRAPDKFSIEQVNGAMGLCNRRALPCPIYLCGAE